MKAKIRLAFLLALIGPLLGGSTDALAEGPAIDTLDQSIAEAMSNNNDFKATAEAKNQAIMLKNQAKTDFLPKASTSYGYTRLSEGTQFYLGSGPPITIGTKDNYEWRGTLTQPLFTGFALMSTYELARLGIDQADLNIAQAKLDLALAVKTAYFNVLIADKAIEVAQKAVVSLDSNRNVADNFYQVGVIPVNDLLKAEVELANARQKLVAANNAAVLARASFNNVLSRPLTEPVQLEDILKYVPEKDDFEELVSRALQNRPEIKLIDVRLLALGQEKRLASSAFYPTVNLSYDYIKDGDTPSVSGSAFAIASRWEVTAGLTWTFWEWGKTRYAVSEKESAAKELKHTRDSLVESIGLQVRNAMLGMMTAEENIPTTEKALAQAEENLRVNEERYKAQVTTITEVLDAQTLLTEARVNHYRALYDHNLARAKLFRALGTY